MDIEDRVDKLEQYVHEHEPRISLLWRQQASINRDVETRVRVVERMMNRVIGGAVLGSVLGGGIVAFIMQAIG